MFLDEAGFGRINKPKYCWCKAGVRPSVPCHQIREYRYAYGAVDPIDGDKFFLVLPSSNRVCMDVFLNELSINFPNDLILACCDRATWHTTNELKVPANIQLFFLPPATPEMNPIEQIWTELRKSFKNEVFNSLELVVDRLCLAIQSLTKSTVRSITGREWILDCF